MPSIDVFRNDPKARPFVAGETILEDGTSANDEMYVVIEGEVEIGGIFGKMALVDSRSKSCSRCKTLAARVVT